MKRLCRAVALAACLAGSAQAGLPLGLEGSWYSPPQSGHGLTVERIDPERALLFWHVFDPEGRPLTLYIEAALEGERLVGEALAPMGMRFGSFDPSELELPVWGQVSLEFLDCNQAVLRYDAVAPGYGQGEIALTRLLPSKDPHCSLTAATNLQTLRGRALLGEIQLPASLRSGYGEPGYLSGGIAGNGHVLANVSGESALILEGRPSGAAPGQIEMSWRVLDNTWSNALFGEDADRLRPVQPLLQFRSPLVLNEDGSEASAFHFAEASNSTPAEFRLGFGSRAWDGSAFRPGRYLAVLDDPALPAEQGGNQPALELRLQVDGSLCLRVGAPAEGDCLMQGQLTPVGEGTYDLELTPLDPDEPVYRGVARFASYTLVIIRRFTLELVASNGVRGLSIRGTLQEGQP